MNTSTETCVTDNCELVAIRRYGSLCTKHYELASWNERGRPPCGVAGCENASLVDFCKYHRYKRNKFGDPNYSHVVPKEIRFWQFLPSIETLEDDECWEWRGCTFRGYGQFGKIAAHRFAWELANGRKIPSGLHVLHSCDNPPCVNPSHLRVGTPRDNSDDKVSRMRQKWGEGHPRARLIEAEVNEIRRLREVSGWTFKAIAEQFGISESHASRTARGLKWSHLGERLTS